MDFIIPFLINRNMDFVLSNEWIQTSRTRDDVITFLITLSSLIFVQYRENNIRAKGNTIRDFDRSLMIPSTYIYYFHLSSGAAHSTF